MKVRIAEKASVLRDIADIIGAKQRKGKVNMKGTGANLPFTYGNFLKFSRNRMITLNNGDFGSLKTC